MVCSSGFSRPCEAVGSHKENGWFQSIFTGCSSVALCASVVKAVLATALNGRKHAKPFSSLLAISRLGSGNLRVEGCASEAEGVGVWAAGRRERASATTKAAASATARPMAVLLRMENYGERAKPSLATHSRILSGVTGLTM
jgi:hypothetical protein